jgi:DNA-binding CsgD family transcriptional regulator
VAVARWLLRQGSDRAPALLGEAALACGGAVVTAGVSDPALVAVLEEALAAQGDADSGLRARLLARLAIELYYSPERERGADLSRLALAIARRAGERATLAYVFSHSHLSVWRPENVAERLEIAAETLRLAEAAGDRALAAQGHHARLCGLLEFGDLTGADRELAEHARLARALREPLFLWNAALWRAMRALLDGRFAEAEPLAQAAFVLGQRAQRQNAGLFFAAQLFTLRREQGRLAELAPTAAATADRYPNLPVLRCWLALLYAELGKPGEARVELERLAADDFACIPRDILWLASLAMLADVCVALGDRATGAILYERLRPFADRVIVVGNAVVVSGAAALFLGRLATLLDRHAPAARHFEDAIAIHSRMGARPLLAHTQCDHAAILLARLRDEDARTAEPAASRDLEHVRHLLREAQTTARELGMAPLAAAADERLAVLQPRRAPTGEQPVAFPGGLTAREAEVLRLLAAGRTSKEIGEQLVISLSTVERHITNLYGKINARSRADATAFAFRHGLTETP